MRQVGGREGSCSCACAGTWAEQPAYEVAGSVTSRRRLRNRECLEVASKISLDRLAREAGGGKGGGAGKGKERRGKTRHSVVGGSGTKLLSGDRLAADVSLSEDKDDCLSLLDTEIRASEMMLKKIMERRGHEHWGVSAAVGTPAPGEMPLKQLVSDPRALSFSEQCATSASSMLEKRAAGASSHAADPSHSKSRQEWLSDALAIPASSVKGKPLRL